MKRTVAFVISFTLSFPFFFSSMAMAEEVQTPIPQVTSKLTNSEIILQASPLKASSANLFSVGKEINAKLLMNVNREGSVFDLPETCVPRQEKCRIGSEIGYCMDGTCAPGGNIKSIYEKFITAIYNFLSTLLRFFRFSQ